MKLFLWGISDLFTPPVIP